MINQNFKVNFRRDEWLCTLRRHVNGAWAKLTVWFVVVPLLTGFSLSAHASSPDGNDSSTPCKLVFDKSFPSGVALVGEEGQYTLKVENCSDEALSGTVLMDIQVPGEAAENTETWEVSLEPGQSKTLTWTAPTQASGYHVLNALARDAQGRELGRTVSGLLVVGEPLSERLPPEESFFGVMIINDPKAAARVGVRVDRVSINWVVVQPKEAGVYNWDKPDRLIRDRLDAGIGLILDLRPTSGLTTPGGAKWSSCEELSEEEYLHEFGDFVRAVVERYKDKILAVEIMNEPDLMCEINSTGRIPTSTVYARLLEEGYWASKSVAPDLPVIGLSVAGSTLSSMAFPTEVMERAPLSMDIMGAHPYTSARRIGGDQRPLSPLKMDLRAKFQLMIDFMRENDLQPRIWSTELGWALYEYEPFNSQGARLFGAYTAQALVLARTIPEAEKLCWFAFSYPGYEHGYTYGMFQKLDARANPRLQDGEWFPIAPAAAYATCARLLDDVTFIDEFKIGAMVYGFRFRNETAARDIIALWVDEPHSTGGSARLTLPPDSPEPLLTVDALGREHPVSKSLTVEPLPLFLVVPSSEGEAMEAALTEAQLQASESLTVQTPVVTREDEITLSLSNNNLQALPAKVYVDGELSQAQSVLLEPGVSELTIPSRTPLDTPVQAQLVVLNERTGEELRTPLAYDIHALPHVKYFSDLRGQSMILSQPVLLNTREQVLPPDPFIDWKGPQDLSVVGRAGWTPEGIVLLLEVTDEVHAGAPPQSNGAWQFDSVQVGFDMSNRAAYGYDEFCYEYGAALTDDGPEAACYVGDPALANEVEAKIVREGTTTTYRLFFPWKALGGKALKPGDVFRMNFVVNDNDGQKRECWIGMSPGIGESKQPDIFPQWMLR